MPRRRCETSSPAPSPSLNSAMSQLSASVGSLSAALMRRRACSPRPTSCWAGWTRSSWPPRRHWRASTATSPASSKGCRPLAPTCRPQRRIRMGSAGHAHRPGARADRPVHLLPRRGRRAPGVPRRHLRVGDGRALHEPVAVDRRLRAHGDLPRRGRQPRASRASPCARPTSAASSSSRRSPSARR